MSEDRLIPNGSLRRADLPSAEDDCAIFRFAMTFDGYATFGSFEACAAEAAAGRRESLTDVRNELFFSARASRHSGDDAFVETYRALLPLFHEFLDGSERTFTRPTSEQKGDRTP